MKIYPAVDIKDGACVRLKQGLADDKTVYYKNPVDAAKFFADSGSDRIHVVDLDGAFDGRMRNLKIIEAISSLGMFVELGGGMRDIDAVRAALDAGVDRAIIGTLAAKSPEKALNIAGEYGGKVAVGIDAKNGMVAVHGWVDVLDISALDLAVLMAKGGVGTFIYTDISTDGMLSGPNIPAQRAMAKALSEHGAELIASGGVSCLDDILAIDALSKENSNLHGAIVGKAIYEGRVELAEALKALK